MSAGSTVVKLLRKNAKKTKVPKKGKDGLTNKERAALRKKQRKEKKAAKRANRKNRSRMMRRFFDDQLLNQNQETESVSTNQAQAVYQNQFKRLDDKKKGNIDLGLTEPKRLSEIDDAIKQDKKLSRIQDRVTAAAYSASANIGSIQYGVTDEALSKSVKKLSKKLNADVTNIENLVNKKFALTVKESTAQKILKTETKVQGLLQKISDDMIDEQDTSIKPIQSVRENQQALWNAGTSKSGKPSMFAKGGKGSIVGSALLLAGLGATNLLKKWNNEDDKADDAENAAEDLADDNSIETNQTELADTGFDAMDAASMAMMAPGISINKNKVQVPETLKETKITETEKPKTSAPKTGEKPVEGKDSWKNLFKKGGKYAKYAKLIGPIGVLVGLGISALEIVDALESGDPTNFIIKVCSIVGTGAGAVVGGALGSIFPGFGTLIGTLLGGAAGEYLGEAAGNLLAKSETAQAAATWAINKYQQSATIDDLEDRKIIEHNTFGNSEILDYQALESLDKKELQALYDLDDWSKEDKEYIKNLLRPKPKHNDSKTDMSEITTQIQTLSERLDYIENDYLAKSDIVQLQKLTKTGAYSQDYLENSAEQPKRSRHHRTPQIQKVSMDMDNVQAMSDAIASGNIEQAYQMSDFAVPEYSMDISEFDTLEPAQIDDTSKDLGSYVRKYESGSKGPSAVGWDSTGGTSYGSYQIIEKNMPAAMQFFRSTGGKGAYIADQMESVGYSGGPNGRGAMMWRALATKDPQEMAKLEHAYIKSTHYDKAFNALDGTLQGVINSDRGLQEALWSTSVQHGPAGAAAIFKGTYNPDIAEWIRSIYQKRSTQFGKSTARVQQSVMNRLKDEVKLILGLSPNGKTSLSKKSNTVNTNDFADSAVQPSMPGDTATAPEVPNIERNTDAQDSAVQANSHSITENSKVQIQQTQNTDRPRFMMNDQRNEEPNTSAAEQYDTLAPMEKLIQFV